MMKKNILTLLILPLAMLNAKALNDNPVKSTIDKVTVYLQNARIKRNASIDLKPGMNNFTFDDLSPNIIANSVQIKIKDMSIGLRSIQALNEYVKIPKKDQTRINTIRDSLQILTKETQRIEIKKRAIKESQKTLQKNNPLGSNKEQGFTSAELKNFMDMRRSEYEKHEFELFELREAVEKNNATKQRLKREERQLKQKGYKRQGVIKLNLDATKATNTSIEISYLVSGASWSPIYDLRSNSTEDGIELKQKATVYQNTGIDWKNIKLSVSNTNPNTDNNRPVMHPLYLALGTKSKYKSKKKGYMQYNNNVQIQQYNTLIEQDNTTGGQTTSANDEDEAINSNGSRESGNDTYVDGVRVIGSFGVPEADIELIEMETEQVEIELEGTHSLSSGATAQVIEVQTHELKADYEYYIIPKLEKAAFLLAKITDYAGLNLIPGPMNIFYEGTYLGQSKLNTNAVTDTLLLSLGRDEGVSVQRLKIKKERKTGISTTKETAVYELKIRNNKSNTINIRVLDQIPVATNDDIVVKLLEKSSATYNQEIGSLKWIEELSPNKIFKKRISYEIKYPKNKYIYKK